MSNYYEYREVKVMIAHTLMKMDGWNVLGYKPDESEMQWDYWDPANWGGIATKNGYVLVVDCKHELQESKPVYDYSQSNKNRFSPEIYEKIKKLSEMTVERGCSEQEEKTAKKKIAILLAKNSSSSNYENGKVLKETIPAHRGNPPRCNWHVELNGAIIAKGNGILKFTGCRDYYTYDHYKNELDEFRSNQEEYRNKLLRRNRLDYSPDRAEKITEYKFKELEEKIKLCDEYENWIKKIDFTCGNSIGEATDLFVYETVKVTEYKQKNYVHECEGKLQENQCFILKGNFTHGCSKGSVYRVHEVKTNNGNYYTANKLNSKLTKELTGRLSNHWNYFSDKFFQWIDKGLISWCEIRTMKVPCEVEKTVKRYLNPSQNEENRDKNKEKKNRKSSGRSEKSSSASSTSSSSSSVSSCPKYNYVITEDIDTRDNSKIYLVRVEEKLSKEKYIELAEFIKEMGGYYSRYKHGFVFKENPEEKLR